MGCVHRVGLLVKNTNNGGVTGPPLIKMGCTPKVVVGGTPTRGGCDWPGDGYDLGTGRKMPIHGNFWGLFSKRVQMPLEGYKSPFTKIVGIWGRKRERNAVTFV